VPKAVAYFLENINRSTPKLPDKRLLDERIIEEQERSHQNVMNYTWKPTDPIFNTVREMINDPKHGLDNWRLLNMYMNESECNDIFEFVQLQ